MYKIDNISHTSLEVISMYITLNIKSEFEISSLSDLPKLKQMGLHLPKVIDFSVRNQLSFVDKLIKLTNYEIDVREQNMIHAMVKVAAFPHLKEIKDFDFDLQPSINNQQIMDFLSLRFIEKNENIVFLGLSGVGETHLATSIGIADAKKRTSTYLLSAMI